MKKVPLSQDQDHRKVSMPPSCSVTKRAGSVQTRSLLRSHLPQPKCWVILRAKLRSNLLHINWIHMSSFFSPQTFLSQINNFYVKNIFIWKKLCASSISTIQRLDLKIALLLVMSVINRIKFRNVFRRQWDTFAHNDFIELLILFTPIESTS